MFTTLMGASLIFGIGGLCRFIEDEVEVLEGVVGGLKRERRFPYICFLVGMLGPKLKPFCLTLLNSFPSNDFSWPRIDRILMVLE